MFLKKVLGRTVAATATTGLLVAPLALTVAPQMANVSCSPGETTGLSLQRESGQYGTKTRATASVDASHAGEVVTFALEGPSRAQTIDRRIDDSGQAWWVLPRGLAAGRTYDVTARHATCATSPIARYSVTKATSDPAPTVIRARRGTFGTTVNGGGGLDPATGPAKFIVRKRGGAVVDSKVAFLSEGFARANLKDLSRGRYILKVRFNMEPVAPESFRTNNNFLVGTSKVAFRVR